MWKEDQILSDEVEEVERGFVERGLITPPAIFHPYQASRMN